jgi:hypothetical protein
MRLLFSALFVSSCVMPSAAAFQARGAADATKSTIHACSLLTKELVRKVTPYEGKALEIVLMANSEPEEDTLGAGGSDCTYGGVAVQIDPRFTFEAFKKEMGEHAERVDGVGDEALFRDNIGEWGDMVVRSGPHLLTIRMDIPKGKSAASIKPNVVALAKELLPKLK